MPADFPALKPAFARWAAAAALCLLAGLFFWRLGAGSLKNWDEALNGERSREFLLGAPWHTPHMNGKPDFNKPPLYFWLTALAMRIGGVNEFTARMWSAIFGFGCVVTCYFLAARLAHDRLAGWIAGFLLALCPEWLNQTRMVSLSSGSILGMLAGVWLLARRPLSARAALCSGAVVALGGMVKGPFTPAAYLFSLGLSLNAPSQRGRRLGMTALAFGASLAFLAPWHLLQAALWGTEQAQRYYVYSIVDRITVGVTRFSMSPFTYMTRWFNHATALALAFALGAALLPLARKGTARRAAVPLIAAAAVLGLLMSMATRLSFYLIFALPWAAVAAGIAWAGLLRNLPSRRAAALLLAAAFIGQNLAFWPQYRQKLDYSHYGKRLARSLKDEPLDRAGLFLYGGQGNLMAFYVKPGWRKLEEGHEAEGYAEAFAGGATVLYTATLRSSLPILKSTGEGRFKHKVIELEQSWALLRTTQSAEPEAPQTEAEQVMNARASQ